jgi:excisionase family DNA binding protein
MSERRLFDIAAAAEYLSVGDDMIRSLVHQGKLPRVMVGTKKYLFDREDLDRLIESEKTTPSAPKTAPIRTGANRKKAKEIPFKWLEKHGVVR